MHDLFVDEYLHSITAPELMHEPVDRGRFDLFPTSGSPSIAGLTRVCQSVQTVPGNPRHFCSHADGEHTRWLDIEQAWAENVLKG